MGYENVDKLNKLLAGRKFHVCRPVFQNFVYLDECLDFNIEVLEIRDSRVRVKINVLKNVTDEQSEKFWEILGRLLSRQDYYLIEKLLGKSVYKVLKHFGFSDYTVSDWEYIEPEKNNDMLQEDKVSRKNVRELIRDIIFKIKPDIHAPQTLNYEAIDAGFGSQFDLELVINKGVDLDDNTLKPYDLEGYWDDDTNSIEIFLNVDPEANHSIFYELIGDLNDMIYHELRHKKQYEAGYEPSNRVIKKPETYYTQPHEIDAQIAGLKRKAKIQGRDFEEVLREFFDKRRKKYKLTDGIINRIVQKIMNEY